MYYYNEGLQDFNAKSILLYVIFDVAFQEHNSFYAIDTSKENILSRISRFFFFFYLEIIFLDFFFLSSFGPKVSLYTLQINNYNLTHS